MMKMRKVITGLAVIILIAGLVGLGIWYTLFRVVPGPYDGPDVSAAEYYKYGSIGTEAEVGVPYWIWLVLPRIFPEYLPGAGGYTSLGMVWETGQETPVGITKQDIGIVPRAGINCAICHTVTYRENAAQVAPTIAPGGAAQRFDLLSYQRFLFACAGDPRFTADVILDEISYFYEFPWYEALLYRYVIIPQTRKGILETKAAWAWTERNPDWGPGRIDPFNPVKFGILEQPVDDTIGNSDMMPAWNLRLREGTNLHWDGLNSSVTEVVRSSAIGDGTRPEFLDVAAMQRIEAYLKETTPPPYPYPVDDDLAAAGAEIYDAQCAMCHEPGRERNGQVIPVAEVGTDPHRAEMWGQKDADAYNATYRDYAWDFNAFQNIEGYVATPLDGLWLRAPYLHNGSIPGLVDLLETPDNRPVVFYRGYDVYDPEQVGFISDVVENEANGNTFFKYDTSLPGNSNQGHLYGTELPAADKEALIEYLKTK